MVRSGIWERVIQGNVEALVQEPSIGGEGVTLIGEGRNLRCAVPKNLVDFFVSRA